MVWGLAVFVVCFGVLGLVWFGFFEIRFFVGREVEEGLSSFSSPILLCSRSVELERVHNSEWLIL